MTRIATLSRYEMLLFWRNRTALATAVLLPVATVGTLITLEDGAAGPTDGAGLLIALVGLMLLLVVYYNLVSTYVARREERVLKRLRAGEVTDGEILAGTAVPAVVIALGQMAIMAGGFGAFLPLPLPVNPLVLIIGLAGAVVLLVGLAVISSTFTRNVEMAQISTLPVLLVCSVGSGLFIPITELPGQLATVARFLPFSPAIELIRLGWLGTADDSAATDFLGVLSRAAGPAAILAGWVSMGVVGVRRWFRWEPRS